MSKKRMEFPMEVKRGSVIVKIYKVENKGRPSFTVSYFADGRRIQKMFADFDEARQEAEAKALAISKGEVDVLHLSRADALSYVHAVEALKPTGMPLELAAKEYTEAWKALGGKGSILEAATEFARRHLHESPSKFLPDAVTEMLEAKAREGVSQLYMKVLRFYLGKLADAFHCSLRSVTTSQLADFLRGMEVSSRSKNNIRQAAGTFFKYCRERGWLPKDHDGIALVPKFKEKAAGIQIFTPHEMATLLTYARPEMMPFLAIGAFAGLRSAEIERLDWAEVHLAERFIEVKAAKAKTASRRIVPMTENLAKWLASHARGEGRVVPFDNVNKQIGWLVEDANEGLKAVAKKEKKDPENLKLIKWKKNGLRHSFISYRVADIQNVNQVALECGNSSAVIFKHYRELVRPDEAKKWFAVVPEVDGKVTTITAAVAA